jgi:hypothetical protein
MIVLNYLHGWGAGEGMAGCMENRESQVLEDCIILHCFDAEAFFLKHIARQVAIVLFMYTMAAKPTGDSTCSTIRFLAVSFIGKHKINQPLLHK